MKKILIYGDSNTWGDNFITGIRIPDNKQWPNILQNILGNDYKIFQEGLPGRIAGNEDECRYKNGYDTFIPTFKSSAPIDILIIQLGINDLQKKYNKTEKKIFEDLILYNKILEKEFNDEDNKNRYFKNKLPRIIYILPSNINASELFDKASNNKKEKILELFNNSSFEYVYVNDLELFEDGIHFNYNGHKLMAEEVAKEILKNE